jgi:transcriptional regulator with XRE-family HTH domain
LREEKSLTQLYIATFVGVTTDTVSRWENKRYPSIKKENGVKLAEALEVELADILDSDEPPEETIPDAAPARRTVRIPLKTLALAVPVILLCTAALLYFLHKGVRDPQQTDISVRRFVPPHFVPGQVLPIFISVSTPDRSTASIILKERLPPEAKVLSTYPEVSGKQLQGDSITWLTKTSGTTGVLYTVRSAPAFKGQLDFNGSIKIGSENQVEIPVTGNNSSTTGVHHWADGNRDNRISDEEILAVYDLIDIDAVTLLDIDLIEEMWLGDGYRYHPSQQRFVTIE